MTQEDLKHALISLVIAVATAALIQILNGCIHILQQWMTTATGAGTGVVAYISQAYKCNV